MADYTMYRGDTLVLNIQVKDQYGAPKNITGGRLFFTMKYTVVDMDNMAIAALTSTPANGIVIVSAPGGTATVTMPPITTRSFADGPTTCVYDVQLIEQTGQVTTVEAGTVTVLPDVSRAIT